MSLLFFQLQHLTGGQAQILYKGYLGAYEGGLAQLLLCVECGWQCAGASVALDDWLATAAVGPHFAAVGDALGGFSVV